MNTYVTSNCFAHYRIIKHKYKHGSITIGECFSGRFIAMFTCTVKTIVVLRHYRYI